MHPVVIGNWKHFPKLTLFSVPLKYKCKTLWFCAKVTRLLGPTSLEVVLYKLVWTPPYIVAPWPTPKHSNSRPLTKAIWIVLRYNATISIAPTFAPSSASATNFLFFLTRYTVLSRGLKGPQRNSWWLYPAVTEYFQQCKSLIEVQCNI